MTPTVTIIGDSLTVDAAKDKRKLFPSHYRIRATPGYTVQDSMPRICDEADNPPDVLVLALGSNDVAERHDDMHEWQKLAAELSSGSGLVMFTEVKIYGVTPFYNPQWELWAKLWRCFLDCDERNPMGWASIAHRHRNDWFLADGLHHNAAGRKGYANSIIKGIANRW